MSALPWRARSRRGRNTEAAAAVLPKSTPVLKGQSADVVRVLFIKFWYVTAKLFQCICTSQTSTSALPCLGYAACSRALRWAVMPMLPQDKLLASENHSSCSSSSCWLSSTLNTSGKSCVMSSLRSASYHLLFFSSAINLSTRRLAFKLLKDTFNIQHG